MKSELTPSPKNYFPRPANFLQDAISKIAVYCLNSQRVLKMLMLRNSVELLLL